MIFSRPYVVGILNVTPDSFSDGGQFVTMDAAFRQIEAMVTDGADMIDIGAESTRPGAELVGVDEELRRLEPILSGIRSRFDIPFSVDTMKSKVADFALNCGVNYINDVSAMRMDAKMASVIASHHKGVILMHMQGLPQTMQLAPFYDDVVRDVCEFLTERIAAAKAAGITDIVVDPGMGFGKTVAHQVQLMVHLDQVAQLGCPVMLGVSRKSMIGALTGATLENRLSGSLSAAVMGLTKGALMFRVHDVAETRHALDVAFAILKG